MLAGQNRENVKHWIEGLPTETRVIFVLRAVAGLRQTRRRRCWPGPGEKAPKMEWEAVRGIFRQGLCSLASQLIRATTAK